MNPPRPFVRKSRATGWWYVQVGPGPYVMSDYYVNQDTAFRNAERMFRRERH